MGPDKKEFSKLKPIRRLSIKKSIADRYPRNALCPCKSGKKYKRCCWAKGNEPGPDFVTSETINAHKKTVAYANKKYKKLTGKDWKFGKDIAGKLQKSSCTLEA